MFSSIIGATLKEVQYIGTTICYFEFDNGQRLFFASRDIGNRNRVGTFEIRAKDNAIDIEHLKIERICGINGTVFSSSVTRFEENAIALFCDDAEYILYPYPKGNDKYKFEICSCSKALLNEYARQYQLKYHSQISCFNEHDDLQAIRIDYPEGHFYIVATENGDIEIQLSDKLHNPLNSSAFLNMEGKRIEFQKRKV